MAAIITFLVFIFLFYFLASFNSTNANHRIIFIGLFFLSTLILRSLIDPELNKDYFGYFDLHDFKIPESFLSFLLGEPYLKIIYAFFSLFTDEKAKIFTCIYWLNLLIANSFFVWLLTRTDVQMWKKVILFSFFYFLFAFVLIRNTPAYILFAVYFYYSFRKLKFNAVLLTPFIHISSVAVLGTYFHKKKNYFLLFILFSIIVASLLLFILPSINNVFAIELTVSKVNAYSAEMEEVSIFHKVYFVFISSVVIFTALVYKKQVLHPIIVTAVFLYYATFTINPIMGFRFVPFLLFSIFLFNYNGAYNKEHTRIFNLASFAMILYFVYTFIDTHYL